MLDDYLPGPVDPTSRHLSTDIDDMGHALTVMDHHKLKALLAFFAIDRSIQGPDTRNPQYAGA